MGTNSRCLQCADDGRLSSAGAPAQHAESAHKAAEATRAWPRDGVHPAAAGSTKYVPAYASTPSDRAPLQRLVPYPCLCVS